MQIAAQAHSSSPHSSQTFCCSCRTCSNGCPHRPLRTWLFSGARQGVGGISQPRGGLTPHALFARWLRMEAFRILLQLAAAAITLGFPLFHPRPAPLAPSRLHPKPHAFILFLQGTRGDTQATSSWPRVSGWCLCMGSRSVGTETHRARSERAR